MGDKHLDFGRISRELLASDDTDAADDDDDDDDDVDVDDHVDDEDDIEDERDEKEIGDIIERYKNIWDDARYLGENNDIHEDCENVDDWIMWQPPNTETKHKKKVMNAW